MIYDNNLNLALLLVLAVGFPCLTALTPQSTSRITNKPASVTLPSKSAEEPQQRPQRRVNYVATYTAYWEKLLLAEHQETVQDFKERQRTWSKQKLEESGFSIFHACAEPDSEILGEKVVRIHKPSLDDKNRLLWSDRFHRGDVLVMTAEAVSAVAAKFTLLPREMMVIDVGPDWLTAGVGPTWPAGLWETRKHPEMYRVRVDRAPPQAPLRAQRNALDQIRRGVAGPAAALLAQVFHNATQASQWASENPFSSTKDDEDNTQMERTVLRGLNEAKKTSSFVPNQSQQDAIVWALQRKMSLIRGPPGTGKTRTAALLISTALSMQQHELQSTETTNKPPRRVLAVTHSNGAADVLLEALLQLGVPAIRVGRPASIAPHVRHRTVVAMAEKMPEVVALRQRARP